jgi:hypothetical protein
MSETKLVHTTTVALTAIGQQLLTETTQQVNKGKYEQH